MEGMKQALLIVTLFLALTGAADAALYPGKSQGLAPAVKEIGFANVLAFQPANKPAVALRSGTRTASPRFTRRAERRRHGGDRDDLRLHELGEGNPRLAEILREVQEAVGSGRHPVEGGGGNEQRPADAPRVTACGNVYLDVVEQNPGSVTGIDTDVAKINNAVFSRATARGLTSCSAK